MFKLQRPTNTNRPSKPKPDRVEFKFSNFQALQVPKGWDRLFVSLIDVETGKTMAKLGKSLVRNGSCQWTEALSEFIYLTRDDSSKGYEDCIVKLIISTGSTRSTTLGEININMAHFTSSRVTSAVSQPLKRSSYGTILQLKIQCLTPRSKAGSSNSQETDGDVHYHETDAISYKSDNSSNSTPRKDSSTTSSPLKLDIQVTNQSASGTTQSFDSLEGSIGKQNLSTKRSLGNQEEAVNRRSISSSKHLLEAADDTIDELRAEAKMWERNARKLMIDLDISRKEFSDQSKKQLELVLELSAAHAEQDESKKEIEKLKLELEKRLTINQCTQDPIVQSENLVQIQKVLENEMKYQQDLNDNISEQLKRSQESNIELVSVLQELEETLRDKNDELENERKSNRDILLRLEKDYEYKMSTKEEEIASLEATLSGYVKGEHFFALDDNNENNVKENELLRGKIKELEKDCAELTDENLELLFKLKDSNKVTDFRKSVSSDSMSSENRNACLSDESEVSDPKFQNSVNTELERKSKELENTLFDLESQIRRLEGEITEKNQVNAALQESELKVRDLTGQLASSKQNHEKLRAETEEILQLLENYKRNEEKLRNDLNELELKYKISDYELQELTKEKGILKVQLQNMLTLQDEMSTVKSELEGCKDEKGKLELVLQTVSGDYEKLEAENILLCEKNSILQDTVSEFDECKRDKLVLEEKLVQMETAKEIICIQNKELKNELSEIKRENVQFRKKIYRLEEENIECGKKAQALEAELKLLKERNNIYKEGGNNQDSHVQRTVSVSMDHGKNKVLQESRNKMKSTVSSITNGEVVARERYERTKSSLETELRDLKERYLEMSLKYAEVETEREDLVMKLRANRGGKRWFS